MTIVIAILIFGALILIHEGGHFTAARIFGVTVNEFSIGMGPKLLSHVSKKSGTRYSLRLLPIGGYVSMEGEDESSEDTHAFCNKPVWQRIIIVVAGAFMNILIGLLLMAVMVMTSKALGSTTISAFQSEDAVTHAAGLEIGDRIIRVGDAKVHTSTELVYEIMHDGIKPIDVTVVRGGKEVVLHDVTFPTETEEGILIGTVDFYVQPDSTSFGAVAKQAFYQSCSAVKMLWESLFDLVTGRYGMEAVSGPVGVTQTISDAVSYGSTTLLYMCALIALNLGMFNLLPIPALDGGRLFFLLLELIRGKPIRREVEGYIHFAGIVILLGFMLFITYKDIMKLL